MGKKESTPLFGYADQPATYPLADGTELNAGEAVEQAAHRYHLANPGLDESQVPAAWNNLDDATRRRFVEGVVELRNEELAAGAAVVDTANVLDAVGADASKQLGACLIDAALTEVKALQRPWQQMTEDQQRDVLERITSQVRAAVGDTIRLLATNGRDHIVCELESITIKKGAKATLDVPRAGLDEALLDAVGAQVILVVGGSLGAAKEIQTPKPDPDQGNLLAQANLGNGDDGLVQHSDPKD